MITQTQIKKNPRQAKLVNQIHDETAFLEAEAPEEFYRNLRKRSSTYRMKTTLNRRGVECKKPVKIITNDNRERWKLLREIYWFNVIQLPQMVVEAKSR